MHYNSVLLACSKDLKESFHKGDIKNSDLKMVGLLMLWLLMEKVCQSYNQNTLRCLAKTHQLLDG